MVTELSKRVIENSELRKRLVNRYIEKVCKYFDTTIEEAYSHRKCRKQPYILVRYYVYRYLHKYTKKSLTTIGLYFEQPHSTVINALNSIDAWILSDSGKKMYDLHLSRKALILKGEVASVMPKVKSLPRRFQYEELIKLVELCFNQEAADDLNEFYMNNKDIYLHN